MFSTSRFYGYPQAPEYTNYTALAKARAAEAAAKAAEAEYYALEAARREQEALMYARSPFLVPCDTPAPSYRFTNHVSAAPCNCCNTSPRAARGFSYGRQELVHHSAYADPAYGYALAPVSAGHGAHHHHAHRHQRQAPAPPRPSLAELELSAKLEEERQARIRLERELKHKELQLEARQRELARTPLFEYHAQPQPAPQAHEAEFDLEEFFGALLGYQQVRTAKPPAAAKARPTLAPQAPQPKAKPAPTTCKPTTQSEDFTNVLLQNILNYGGYVPESAPKKAQEIPNKTQNVPKNAQEAPKQAKAPAPRVSLIDQLKSRYQNEGEDEIRDTIQAIVNSLLPENTSKLVSKPAATGSASSSTTSTPDKGKAKELPESATTTSTGQNVDAALQRVDRLERVFNAVVADFTFPPQLDFVSTSSHTKLADSSAILPHLAFTARNHPVRYYEQTLSSLLQQLDLIESHGNASLRSKRKSTVRSIEKALEDLENEVAGRWKASVAKSQEKLNSATESTSETSQDITEAPVAESKPVRIPIVDGEEDSTSSEPSSTSVTASAAEDSEGPAKALDEEDTPVEALQEPEKVEEPVSASSTDVVEPSGDPLESTTSLTFPSLVGPPSEPRAETSSPSPESPTSTDTQDQDEPSALNRAPESSPEPSPSQQPLDVEAGPASPVSSESTEAPAPTESSEDEASDTFLHAQARCSETREKRPSITIEDLGSDWSDLDA